MVLVIDGSALGRGCVAFMVHVVYKGRALPVAWLVREDKKGYVPEAMYITLVKQVQEVVPLGATVVFLGDGEFDGPDLQQTLDEEDWWYACPTALKTTAELEGQRFHLNVIGN